MAMRLQRPEWVIKAVQQFIFNENPIDKIVPSKEKLAAILQVISLEDLLDEKAKENNDEYLHELLLSLGITEESIVEEKLALENFVMAIADSESEHIAALAEQHKKQQEHQDEELSQLQEVQTIQPNPPLQAEEIILQEPTPIPTSAAHWQKLLAEPSIAKEFFTELNEIIDNIAKVEGKDVGLLNIVRVGEGSYNIILDSALYSGMRIVPTQDFAEIKQQINIQKSPLEVMLFASNKDAVAKLSDQFSVDQRHHFTPSPFNVNCKPSQ